MTPALTPPLSGTKAAAFFDLDKTLIDGDAGVLFGGHLLHLARHEYRQATGVRAIGLRLAYAAFLAEVLAKAVYVRSLHKVRLMRRSSVVRTAYTFFKRHRVEDLEAALEHYFQDHLAGRVFPVVADLLDKHRARGDATVLITTGMRPIAERYAALLGIDHVVACELERKGDRLTGRVQGPLWGRDKADEVERLAKEHDWDLTASYAYSDHISDLELLEAVGNPRPVHPDARLRKVAIKRGWPILDLSNAPLAPEAHPRPQ